MFFLGYGSNEHAYRVFKKNSRRVEIAVDVTFDESNGFQVEKIDSIVVGNEEPPCEAIKQLTIGDIRPWEEKAIEVETSQARATIDSAIEARAAVPPSGSAAPHQSIN